MVTESASPCRYLSEIPCLALNRLNQPPDGEKSTQLSLLCVFLALLQQDSIIYNPLCTCMVLHLIVSASSKALYFGFLARLTINWYDWSAIHSSSFRKIHPIVLLVIGFPHLFLKCSEIKSWLAFLFFSLYSQISLFCVIAKLVLDGLVAMLFLNRKHIRIPYADIDENVLNVAWNEWI